MQNDLRAQGRKLCCAEKGASPGIKYVRRLYEADELYNLRADPAELHNRIGDAQAGRSKPLADALARLQDRLLTFYQETCDIVPHDTDQRG